MGTKWALALGPSYAPDFINYKSSLKVGLLWKGNIFIYVANTGESGNHFSQL